jgi:archaellum component FlaC
MKNVVIIVVIILLGLVAFNYITTGEIKLIPGGKTLSPAEQQVEDLKTRFEDARKQYMQAGRGAAVSGIDSSSEAEGALRAVDQIEKEVTRLRDSFPTADVAARAEADRLLREIRDFKSGI